MGRASSGPIRSPQTVQLFKVEIIGTNKKPKTIDINNNQKALTLAPTICVDARFTNSRPAVEYWLKQYVATYPKTNFTQAELTDYLYDDIVMQGKQIGADPVMSAQELLTTENGFNRIKHGKQAFPAHAAVKFYRTMPVTELQAMFTDPARALPVAGEDITASVKKTATLGAHLGDYKQARTYFKGPGSQALLEFTVDSTTFFAEDSLALQKRDSVFKEVLTSKIGTGFKTGSESEGTHPDVPGLKSEGRGLYSVSLSSGATSVFMDKVTNITVIHIK